jgi:hypothetical protein
VWNARDCEQGLDLLRKLDSGSTKLPRVGIWLSNRKPSDGELLKPYIPEVGDLTATYAPTNGSNFGGSSTPAAMVQTVNQETVTFSNPSAPTILLHTPAQAFSGTVGGDGGETPTGSVTITLAYASGPKAGQTAVTATASIGAGGNYSANLTITTATNRVVTGLPVGAYTVTYAYAGDANYPAASTTTPAYISYKIAATIPTAKPNAALNARLHIEDTKGLNLSAPAIAVTVVGIASSSTPDTLITLPANTAHAFTYANHAYHLKLKKNGLAPGQYFLEMTVAGDPLKHLMPFTIS